MNLLRRFIDLLYPPRCLICGAFDDDSICNSCLAGFHRLASPLCTICGEPFSGGIQEDHVCEQCLRKRPFFERVAAPYSYDGQIMDAIHRFKYEGKAHMAKGLGPLLATFGKERLSAARNPLIIPVPLHPKRLRQRGYNQSLLLARHLAAALSASLDFLSLRRIRDTQVQTGLGRDQRRKNVRRAFEVVDRKAVKGRTILLVDDVATTGSTLNECARVLRKAGCDKVHCLVLARAPKGSKR
jgi:ComF family protein